MSQWANLPPDRAVAASVVESIDGFEGAMQRGGFQQVYDIPTERLTERVADLADEFGCMPDTIYKRRAKAGLRSRVAVPDLEYRHRRMLGEIPDAAVAERSGLSRRTITSLRRRAEIEASGRHRRTLDLDQRIAALDWSHNQTSWDIVEKLGGSGEKWRKRVVRSLNRIGAKCLGDCWRLNRSDR